MRPRTPCFALAVLLACGGDSEQSVCHDLCTELTGTCDYDAFPDINSCMQGCEWNAEQGADIAGQTACVKGAACDTFAILECEHAYGID